MKGFVAVNDELGPGIRAAFGCSFDHPDYPIGQGYWDLTRAFVFFNGHIVEQNPDGQGCLLTEIAIVDAGGSIPASIMKKATPMDTTQNFDIWLDYLKKLNK